MAWFVDPDSRNRGDEDETYLAPPVERFPEEQARYEAIGKALKQKLYSDYRAAGKNPYEFALMETDPYFPYLIASPVPSLHQGWRWPMPDEPFRDRLKGKVGPIIDIIWANFGTYAVSQKVIDIIETIEPGVHQYLPYELIQKDGSVHPDRRWLLNVCTRAETLDYERSNVVALRDSPWKFVDKGGKLHLVVRREAVTGRAIWFEYRYVGNHGNFLISDRFWNALNEAGCAGWRPSSFDLGDHIEEV